MKPPVVVYTAGCWDLLHRGHLNFLHQSAQLGDFLIVGVVSDAGARAYKGRLPVQGVQVRMAQVAGLACVSAVVQQTTTDPTPQIERFLPDIMTHGDDWTELREGQETLARFGVDWVTIPYTPGVSTTMLRDKVA